jgi:hypothetical protein
MSLTTNLNVTVKTQPQNFQALHSSAFYYLMKNGFILRLEKALDPKNIPLLIKANLLDNQNIDALNQDQANYRVAIFRDEILEWDEYQARIFGYSS